MVKILMNKTFFELDYEFYKKYPDKSMVCGATGLIMFVIESKIYVFSLGDCRGFLFRNEVLFQLNLPHLPV
jgi:serine/threonine protein phosphatase PrpC